MGSVLKRKNGRTIIQWIDGSGRQRQETLPRNGKDGKPLTEKGAEREGRNLRPLGPEGPNADPHGVAPGHLASYPVDNTGVDGGAGSHTVAPLPPVATPFGAFVAHDAVGQLLTIREVADRLRVSRATVYRLVQAGALPVLRVSNSIRIPTECLTKAVRPPSCLPAYLVGAHVQVAGFQRSPFPPARTGSRNARAAAVTVDRVGHGRSSSAAIAA